MFVSENREKYIPGIYLQLQSSTRRGTTKANNCGETGDKARPGVKTNEVYPFCLESKTCPAYIGVKTHPTSHVIGQKYTAKTYIGASD